MRWPWASKKPSVGDIPPLSESVSSSVPLAASNKTSSKKTFQSGIKLLYGGEDSVVE